MLAGGGDDPGGGQASGTTGATSGATDAAGSTTEGSPVAAVLAVGDCLAGDLAPTACDGEHASEVYSTSGCTPDDLVAYLGGRSGSDVLRSDLALAEVPADGGTACTVGLPGGGLDRASEGVLGGDAGDVWRRCLDGNDTELPCSEDHSAEVIFEQADSTDSLNCVARASQYLGTPFDRHSDDLEVVESGSTCLIQVRGNNVLTASVRDLRSTALPLEAAD